MSSSPAQLAEQSDSDNNSSLLASALEELASQPTEFLSTIKDTVVELEGEVWHQFLDSLKRYLHFAYEKHGLQNQLQRDVMLWKNTFHASRRLSTAHTLSSNRLAVLRRIFLLLRHSTVLYRPENEEQWRKWAEEKWPVAALLSHGGRIIIQLPAEAVRSKQHGFWRWLVTGSSAGNLSEHVSVRRTGQDAYEEGKLLFRRMGSTHSLTSMAPSLVHSLEKTPASAAQSTAHTPSHTPSNHSTWTTWMKSWVHPPSSHSTLHQHTASSSFQQSSQGYMLSIKGTPFKKVVRETKTWGFSMRDSKYFSMNEDYILQHHRHWGMNIALGGDGNMSLSRKLIKPNGSHGHVYFYYQSPDADRYGALMIGVEGSEYGHYDVTGCYHGLSAKSAPFSPTFGYKWHAKEEPSLRKHKGPDKYNSMLIDLSETGWEHLKRCEWRDEIPGETCEM